MYAWHDFLEPFLGGVLLWFGFFPRLQEEGGRERERERKPLNPKPRGLGLRDGPSEFLLELPSSIAVFEIRTYGHLGTLCFLVKLGTSEGKLYTGQTARNRHQMQSKQQGPSPKP